jgi:hypothetical protein
MRYKLSSIPIKARGHHINYDIIETFEDGSCIVELFRTYANSKHTLDGFKNRGVQEVKLLSQESGYNQKMEKN